MSTYAAVAFGSSLAIIVARHLRLTLGHRRERRRARERLESVTTIADVTTEGSLARVTGVIEATKHVLIAPLSGLECVAYRARADSRTQPLIVPVVSMKLARLSVAGIDIEADSAELDVPAVPLFPSPEQRDRYDAFLARLGLERHGPAFSGGATFDETVITDGMRVTVVGTVMHAGAEASGDYRSSEHRWKLVGDREHPIVIGRALD